MLAQEGRLQVGDRGRAPRQRHDDDAQHQGRAAPSGPGGPPDGRRGQDNSQPSAQPSAPNMQKYQREVDTELLVEKEQTIAELREMVGIMSEKIKKLEQLVRIKDSKIEALNQKLQKHGLS